MSAEAAAITAEFRVGKRMVTLTIQKPIMHGVVNMVCEWDPETPRQLSNWEWKQYRAGRDAAVARLAEQTGAKALVVEI